MFVVRSVSLYRRCTHGENHKYLQHFGRETSKGDTAYETLE